MITSGMYIQNSKGEKAYAGDRVKITLLNKAVNSPDDICLITDIRLNGDVMINGCICRNVMGIDDFTLCE